MSLEVEARNLRNEKAFLFGKPLECLLCHTELRWHRDYYSMRGHNALCNDCVNTLSEMFHVKHAEIAGVIQEKLKMTPMSEALTSVENDMLTAVDSLTTFDPIENERAVDVIMRLQNHNKAINAVIRAKKLHDSISKSDQYEIDYKEEMYKALDNKK